MATLDDGAIFKLIVDRVVAIVGIGVSVFVPGDVPPIDSGTGAWIQFTNIEMTGQSAGANDSATAEIRLAGVVVAGAAYTASKGPFALGSLVAKLRAAIECAGFTEAGTPVHQIDTNIMDVEYVPVDNAAGGAMRAAQFGVNGIVRRDSGTGCVTDFSS